MKQYLVSVAVLLCSPLHIFYFFVQKGESPIIVVFLVLGLLFFIGLRKICLTVFPLFRNRRLEYPCVIALAGSVLVAFCAVSLLMPETDMFGLLRKYFGMFASNNAWLAGVTGVDMGSGWKAFLFGTGISLEGILWLLYMLTCLREYPALKPEERIIFMANSIPVISLLFIPAIFKGSWDYYWPYALFLFPAPFLGISFMLVRKLAGGGIFCSANKVVWSMLLFFVIGFNVFMTQYFATHVYKTGGRNLYFSTVGVKEQVMEYIFEDSADPQIFLVLDKSDINMTLLGRAGMLGWRMVAIETRQKFHDSAALRSKDETNRAKVYYIVENEAAFMQSIEINLQKIEAGGTIEKKYFKSVTVYVTGFIDDTVGNPLRYTYDYLLKWATPNALQVPRKPAAPTAE